MRSQQLRGETEVGVMWSEQGQEQECLAILSGRGVRWEEEGNQERLTMNMCPWDRGGERGAGMFKGVRGLHVSNSN